MEKQRDNTAILSNEVRMYTDVERKDDFQFFLEHYEEFFNKYGHVYIAIKNHEILGVFRELQDGIKQLNTNHPLGTYIIQECNGDESGYTNYISSWEAF